MIPLLIWDSVVWGYLISGELKDNGLCGICIFAYIVNFYFFAGFCEEFIKYLVIQRIANSKLTQDWRSLMVYGMAAGCGFACAENLLYVFSSG